MKYTMNTGNFLGQFINKRGFVASTAVMIVASFTILFSSIVMESVFQYSDSVDRKIWREQARLNAESCSSTVALMSVKDYFLSGDIEVGEFGCTAHVIRNHSAHSVTVDTQARFNSITYGTTTHTYSVF